MILLDIVIIYCYIIFCFIYVDLLFMHFFYLLLLYCTSHPISVISFTLFLNLHIDQQIKIFYQSLLLNQQPVDASFFLSLPQSEVLSLILCALFLLFLLFALPSKSFYFLNNFALLLY